MPSFFEDIRKLNRSGAPDSTLILQAHELPVKDPSAGIIIIIATWSGAAKLAYSVLTSALASEIKQGLKVYAVDHDALNPEKVKEIFGIVPEGWGETFWVKNDLIIHQAARLTSKDEAQIKNYARDILRSQ